LLFDDQVYGSTAVTANPRACSRLLGNPVNCLDGQWRSGDDRNIALINCRSILKSVIMAIISVKLSIKSAE
jgi:hypothetical protein